jgi:hypothetical protein
MFSVLFFVNVSCCVKIKVQYDSSRRYVSVGISV